jgi:choline kinase
MIKAIVIAAGKGQRLLPRTENQPKTTLPVFGKPMIDHIFDNFTQSNIKKVAVVTGYKKESLEHLDADFYYNEDYEKNNILHSLMNARAFLESCVSENTDVVISYSDIYYHKSVLDKLLLCKEECAIVVDSDFTNLYLNRDDNHVSEGEMVEYQEGFVSVIGKGINSGKGLDRGEFIGLLKLTPIGISEWLSLFDELNKKLNLTDKFQRASEWQKSYLTDFLQQRVDNNGKVEVCLVSNGWLEFDTTGDYERVLKFPTLNDYQNLYKNNKEME